MSASDARTRLLAPSTGRGMALGLCAGGIIGMIVTSIVDQIDAALTFGFVGAVGALSLLLVGILVPAVEAATSLDEKRAVEVEAGIQRLVDAGANEDDLRATVRTAVELGRRSAGD